MTTYGYTLMGEGHGPRELVRNATLAEEAGFEHVAVVDIGEDPEGFLRFWTEEVRPRLPS